MPVASSNDTRRVLVGGVGYRTLRDHSVGPIIAERLMAQSWPAGVEVDDLSFGPISLVHRLREAQPYHRMVLFGAVAREGRTPGEVYCYRWQGFSADVEEVQARVCEAVTGVISLDNLLLICDYFQVLPAEVAVIEVEPVVEDWGEEFTPPVRAALDRIEVLARELALAPNLERITGEHPLAPRVSV